MKNKKKQFDFDLYSKLCLFSDSILLAQNYTRSNFYETFIPLCLASQSCFRLLQKESLQGPWVMHKLEIHLSRRQEFRKCLDELRQTQEHSSVLHGNICYQVSENVLFQRCPESKEITIFRLYFKAA